MAAHSRPLLWRLQPALEQSLTFVAAIYILRHLATSRPLQALLKLSIGANMVKEKTWFSFRSHRRFEIRGCGPIHENLPWQPPRLCKCLPKEAFARSNNPVNVVKLADCPLTSNVLLDFRVPTSAHLFKLTLLLQGAICKATAGNMQGKRIGQHWPNDCSETLPRLPDVCSHDLACCANA